MRKILFKKRYIFFLLLFLNGCGVSTPYKNTYSTQNSPAIKVMPPSQSKRSIPAVGPIPDSHPQDEAAYRFKHYVMTPKSIWGHEEAERFLTKLNAIGAISVEWDSSSALSISSLDGDKLKCNGVNASRQSVGDDFFVENYGVGLESLDLVSFKISAKPNLSLITTGCHSQGFEKFINAYGMWNIVLPVNGVLFIGTPY